MEKRQIKNLIIFIISRNEICYRIAKTWRKKLITYDNIISEKNIIIRKRISVWMPSLFSINLGIILARYSFKNKTILDIGAGSGFLGIVVMKKGAKYVAALDLNPACRATISDNWKLNGFSFKSLKYIKSNCFTALADNKTYYQFFDVIVCKDRETGETSDSDRAE